MCWTSGPMALLADLYEIYIKKKTYETVTTLLTCMAHQRGVRLRNIFNPKRGPCVSPAPNSTYRQEEKKKDETCLILPRVNV